ncbi:RmlC-like cupin domain-containing protein [Biscogniauxia mediterranea]|nr:RmlC-like cupin domain-containing protein [Biscogniauxia mediterranea]
MKPGTINNFDGEVYTLNELLADIRKTLGPSSGIDSDDVDVEQLMNFMRKYKSNPADWERFAMACEDMGYTRNLVDEGNGKANVLILVWTPKKGSPIHDHGNAHCVMKILKGDLVEERFNPPESPGQAMKPKSSVTHHKDAVAYMSDKLGLHRVSNPGEDYAVSIHCYTPPNVARSGCNIFNVMTGEKTHIAKCENYSAYGRRVENK